MAVHNHGAEEGPGLSCKEITLPDGTIKGFCLYKEDSKMLDTELKRLLLNLYYADAEEDGEEIKYSFETPPDPILQKYLREDMETFLGLNKEED